MSHARLVALLLAYAAAHPLSLTVPGPWLPAKVMGLDIEVRPSVLLEWDESAGLGATFELTWRIP